MNARQRRRAHRNTCGATGSTLLDALREANRHIEALATVRKDNAWDMLAARTARDKIITAMSNDSFTLRTGARSAEGR